MLRPNAPQIRTFKALIEKHEQILDGIERGTLTGKIAEQMNQTLKGIAGVAKLELQYWSQVFKFGRKAPVPRSPLLRSISGLPAEPAPNDAETLRRLLPTE